MGTETELTLSESQAVSLTESNDFKNTLLEINESKVYVKNHSDDYLAELEVEETRGKGKQNCPELIDSSVSKTYVDTGLSHLSSNVLDYEIVTESSSAIATTTTVAEVLTDSVQEDIAEVLNGEICEANLRNLGTRENTENFSGSSMTETVIDLPQISTLKQDQTQISHTPQKPPISDSWRQRLHTQLPNLSPEHHLSLQERKCIQPQNNLPTFVGSISSKKAPDFYEQYCFESTSLPHLPPAVEENVNAIEQLSHDESSDLNPKTVPESKWFKSSTLAINSNSTGDIVMTDQECHQYESTKLNRFMENANLDPSDSLAKEKKLTNDHAEKVQMSSSQGSISRGGELSRPVQNPILTRAPHRSPGKNLKDALALSKSHTPIYHIKSDHMSQTPTQINQALGEDESSSSSTPISTNPLKRKNGQSGSSNSSMTSEPHSPQTKDVLLSELKAIKIESITARNSALETEITSKRALLEKVTSELKAPAAETVQRHIKLLHDYNDIRDIGQGLIGMIAEQRGVRIASLYEEFGVGVGD